MINFLERHVWLSIALFFSIMVGIAWAADTKLSALVELAAAPAESDELYINDGGTSKKIQVINLLKALEAALTSFEIHNDNLDANLGVLAGITYSANMQSFLAAADYAAMRTLLGLVIGTNVQAYDATNLTLIAALTSTAYGRAFLELANEAALQALITTPWADADVANDITIDLATLATTVTVTDNESTDELNPIWFSPGGDQDGGSLGPETDGGFEYNPSSGALYLPGPINPVADGSYAHNIFYAEDTTCTSDYAGKILATPIVGDLGDTDIVWSTCIDGTLTEFMRFESDTGEFQFSYAVTAPSIDAPIIWTGLSSNTDLDSTHPNVCRLDITVTSAIEIELWNDSECGTSGYGKLIHIMFRGASGSLSADPDDGDTILAESAGLSLTAGEKVSTTVKGAYIELRGRDGGTYWDVKYLSLAADWTDGGA